MPQNTLDLQIFSFSLQILNPTLLILTESDISNLGRIYPTEPGRHNSET
jgi:hypothetical protein